CAHLFCAGCRTFTIKIIAYSAMPAGVTYRFGSNIGRMTRQHSTPPPSWLAMAGTVLLYMALAESTATPLLGQGLIPLFQPASGLALVLLMVGGRQLAPALFIGSLLSGLLAGDAPLAAL